MICFGKILINNLKVVNNDIVIGLFFVLINMLLLCVVYSSVLFQLYHRLYIVFLYSLFYRIRSEVGASHEVGGGHAFFACELQR